MRELKRLWAGWWTRTGSDVSVAEDMLSSPAWGDDDVSEDIGTALAALFLAMRQNDVLEAAFRAFRLQRISRVTGRHALCLAAEDLEIVLICVESCDGALVCNACVRLVKAMQAEGIHLPMDAEQGGVLDCDGYLG